jgi:hypothetical protein
MSLSASQHFWRLDADRRHPVERSSVIDQNEKAFPVDLKRRDNMIFSSGEREISPFVSQKHLLYA